MSMPDAVVGGVRVGVVMGSASDWPTMKGAVDNFTRATAVDLALVTSLSDHSEGDEPALPWVGFSARL